LAYIPESTEWFLAEVVQAIHVSRGDDTGELHVLLVLIQAKDPESAYEKANVWGREHDVSYINTDGDLVINRFLGISALNVVYDPLEHGTELLDNDYGAPTPEKLDRLLVPKEDLNVFKPIPEVDWPGRSDL